tara:strand:- start:26041 stop:30663 length:4623 start_codon:yes stop_codon:yes gene_type:complete
MPINMFATDNNASNPFWRQGFDNNTNITLAMFNITGEIEYHTAPSQLISTFQREFILPGGDSGAAVAFEANDFGDTLPILASTRAPEMDSFLAVPPFSRNNSRGAVPYVDVPYASSGPTSIDDHKSFTFRYTGMRLLYAPLNSSPQNMVTLHNHSDVSSQYNPKIIQDVYQQAVDVSVQGSYTVLFDQTLTSNISLVSINTVLLSSHSIPREGDIVTFKVKFIVILTGSGSNPYETLLIHALDDEQNGVEVTLNEPQIPTCVEVTLEHVITEEDISLRNISVPVIYTVTDSSVSSNIGNTGTMTTLRESLDIVTVRVSSALATEPDNDGCYNETTPVTVDYTLSRVSIFDPEDTDGFINSPAVIERIYYLDNNGVEQDVPLENSQGVPFPTETYAGNMYSVLYDDIDMSVTYDLSTLPASSVGNGRNIEIFVVTTSVPVVSSGAITVFLCDPLPPYVVDDVFDSREVFVNATSVPTIDDINYTHGFVDPSLNHVVDITLVPNTLYNGQEVTVTYFIDPDNTVAQKSGVISGTTLTLTGDQFDIQATNTEVDAGVAYRTIRISVSGSMDPYLELTLSVQLTQVFDLGGTLVLNYYEDNMVIEGIVALTNEGNVTVSTTSILIQAFVDNVLDVDLTKTLDNVMIITGATSSIPIILRLDQQYLGTSVEVRVTTESNAPVVVLSEVLNIPLDDSNALSVSITIVSTHTEPIFVGTDINMAIDIENTGSTTATGVDLDLKTGIGSFILAPAIPDIPAGETHTVLITQTVEANELTDTMPGIAGMFTIEAYVTSDNTSEEVASLSICIPETPDAPIVQGAISNQFALVNDVDYDTLPSTGDTVSVTFTAVSQSNVPVTILIVSVHGGGAQQVQNVMPGQSVTLVDTVSSVTAGTLVRSATLVVTDEATGTVYGPLTSTNTTEIQPTGMASLDVTYSVQNHNDFNIDGLYGLGETLEILVRVYNNGVRKLTLFTISSTINGVLALSGTAPTIKPREYKDYIIPLTITQAHVDAMCITLATTTECYEVASTTEDYELKVANYQLLLKEPTINNIPLSVFDTVDDCDILTARLSANVQNDVKVCIVNKSNASITNVTIDVSHSTNMPSPVTQVKPFLLAGQSTTVTVPILPTVDGQIEVNVISDQISMGPVFFPYIVSQPPVVTIDFSVSTDIEDVDENSVTNPGDIITVEASITVDSGCVHNLVLQNPLANPPQIGPIAKVEAGQSISISGTYRITESDVGLPKIFSIVIDSDDFQEQIITTDAIVPVETPPEPQGEYTVTKAFIIDDTVTSESYTINSVTLVLTAENISTIPYYMIMDVEDEEVICDPILPQGQCVLTCTKTIDIVDQLLGHILFEGTIETDLAQDMKVSVRYELPRIVTETIIEELGNTGLGFDITLTVSDGPYDIGDIIDVCVTATAVNLEEPITIEGYIDELDQPSAYTDSQENLLYPDIVGPEFTFTLNPGETSEVCGKITLTDSGIMLIDGLITVDDEERGVAKKIEVDEPSDSESEEDDSTPNTGGGAGGFVAGLLAGISSGMLLQVGKP